MPNAFTTQWRNLAPLFRYRNFVKLWTAQLLGQIGMNALHFILVIQVFERTGNNFAVGILVALLSIPGIFTTQLSGIFADNFSRRKLLVAINIVRMAVTVLILISFKLPAMLILLAFFITMASQAMVPVVQSIIPDLVPKEKLMEANSLYTFSIYGALLIGFGVAGPLLQYTGQLISLITLSGMFLVATLLYKNLPDLNSRHKGAKKTILERLDVGRLKKQFFEGIHYITKNPIVLIIIGQVAFIFAVERSVVALVPSLAQNYFNFSISAISFYMIIPLAIGTIIGIGVVNHFKRRHPLYKLITVGLVLDAIVLLLFPLYNELAGWIFTWTGLALNNPLPLKLYAIVLSFVSGLADVLIIVSAQTFIHKHVDPEIRGRVFASLMTAMSLVGVPMVLIISLFADIVNILVTMVTFGFATLFVAYLGWKFFNKQSRAKSMN